MHMHIKLSLYNDFKLLNFSFTYSFDNHSHTETYKEKLYQHLAENEIRTYYFIHLSKFLFEYR